jgi:(+)-pinoresinol hydroxylase
MRITRRTEICWRRSGNSGALGMTRLRLVLGLSIWQIAGIAAALLLLGVLVAPKLIDTFPFSPQAKAITSVAKVAASPGEQVYIKWCAECHASAMGPGTQALERRYKGEVPAILDKRAGMPADFIKYTVRHGMLSMPPFRKTEISDAELAVLATYLSSVDRTSASKQAEPVQ